MSKSIHIDGKDYKIQNMVADLIEGQRIRIDELQTISDEWQLNAEIYAEYNDKYRAEKATLEEENANRVQNEVVQLEAENEMLLDALEHCGYDPENCIDCGGPSHNEHCRFWKLRHVLSYWDTGSEKPNYLSDAAHGFLEGRNFDTLIVDPHKD